MNDSSSFSETILNVFKERICTPIPYLSKTYNNASLWDKPLKMYEQIEKNQLAVESVIIEAKKHDSFFNGINTPKLYHALLCRVYILVYYKHRDDPLYKEIVFPRLRDNMGIYNSQHLKTINEKIDEILRQEELIKKALQKKKTNNNKPKFSLPKLSKTQLDELFDEYNEEQLFRDFVKFYDEVLHPDGEILDCAELWYGAKDLLKKLNAVRHPESYIERILQQYAEEIGHIGSAEPQYIVMCAYIMMRPLRSIHFAKTIERIEGYIKRDSEYYYLRDSLPNIIRWITTVHPYDVEYNYDMEYLYEKPQETEQTFTKTEVEQMMQSQSNHVVQLENELREAQKRISELEAQRNKSQQMDNDEVERLKTANAQLSEKVAILDEWYNGPYDNLSREEELVLRERVVFFATVLSLDLEKKYTVLSNLATFISELCNDQKSVGPFLSRMKKPEEAAANAKAATRVAGLMKVIIPEEYRNDKHLKINQLVDSMLLNYPEKEE